MSRKQFVGLIVAILIAPLLGLLVWRQINSHQKRGEVDRVQKAAEKAHEDNKKRQKELEDEARRNGFEVSP